MLFRTIGTLRRSVGALIAISLAAPAPAFSVGGEDPIASSYRVADELARLEVKKFIVGSMQSALQAQTSLNLNSEAARLEARLAQSDKERQGTLDRLALLEAQPDGERSPVIAQLRETYRQFVSLRSAFVAGSLKLDGIRRDAFSARSAIGVATDGFLDRLNDLCDHGLEINPNAPTAPGRAIRSLDLGFGVNVGFDEGPTGSLSSADVGWEFAKTGGEKAVWAGGLAVAVAGSATLVHGSLVATQAAFGALGMGAQIGALAMGFGATAIIAVGIMVAQVSAARSESDHIVDEQRNYFLHRADAKYASARVQENCVAARNQVKDLPAEFAGIRNEDPVVTGRIAHEREEKRERAAAYAAVLGAYLQKQAEVLGQNFAQQSKDEKSRRLKAFDQTSEAQDYEKNGNLSVAETAELLAFILRDSYAMASAQARTADEQYKAILATSTLENFEQRATILRKLLSQAATREEEAWDRNAKGEREANAEFASVSAELDSVVLDFAQALFAPIGAEPEAWQALDSRIDHLKGRVQALLNQDSQSLALAQIDTQLNRFVKLTILAQGAK
jgi:hypothetical protein